MVPGALNDLDGEEKNRLYRMLQLEVTPSEEGYEVSGAFCTSGLTSPFVRRKETSSKPFRYRVACSFLLLAMVESWLARA